jgi:DENN (AEX-3) domain
LFGTIMTLPSVSAVGRRPVDFNLGLIFQFMDIQTILFVFTALILQQRIVFLSSSYALLTLITEVIYMIYYSCANMNIDYYCLLSLAYWERILAKDYAHLRFLFCFGAFIRLYCLLRYYELLYHIGFKK